MIKQTNMLVVSPKEYTFENKLTLDVPVEFDFALTNTGTEQIDVFKLSAGCSSCTVATMSMPILKPGETSLVHVTFTPASAGINRKFVNVFYKIGEVEQPSVVLKFKGEVTK